MRRIYDPSVYDFLKGMTSFNELITIGAIGLGFTQLILVANIICSIKWGKKAPRNPWNANTLEWAAPEHPGHGNFDTDITVYRVRTNFLHLDVTLTFGRSGNPILSAVK